MSPNQTKTSNEKPALEIINDIIKQIDGLDQKFIFRGENKHYDDISSTLYRFHEDIFKKDILKNDQSQSQIMSEIQDTIIDDVRSRFKIGTQDEDILSELQHYGGKTNFIDFSHDVYIALFFACHGDGDEKKEDEEEKAEKAGRLILYPYNHQNNYQNIVKNNMVKNIRDRDFCFDPKITNNRIIFQKSVFVHAHRGILKIGEKQIQIIPIKKEDKIKILDYLKKHHNIHENTIYNDLPGFIANENNFGTAQKEFIQGFSEQDKGEYLKAICHYKRAIKIKSDYYQAYKSMGNAYDQLEEYDEAIESYKKAIEIKPDDQDAYKSMGLIYYYELEEYDEAIESYKKAIEIKPDDQDAYNYVGLVYYSLEQYKKAIESYKEAIKLKQDHYDAYYNIGLAYYKLEEYDEAIESYKKVIEINPDDHEAYNSMGLAYASSKDYKKAIECYEKAIKLKSNYDEAHYNMGLAYAKLGKYDEAIKWYDKAIKIKSDYDEAHYNMGLAYTELGQHEKAVVCFKKIKPANLAKDFQLARHDRQNKKSKGK